MNIDTQDAMSAHRFSSLLERKPVKVNLAGRYILGDSAEFKCIAREFSLNRLVLESSNPARVGDVCIVYIDLIGRLEGTVNESGLGRFVVELKMSVSKRAKLAATIDLLRLGGTAVLAEQRRYPRIEPDSPMATLILENGEQIPCEVIDLSLVSASVKTDVRLEIGQLVNVGKMHGKVTRLHSSGFVMEFDTVLEWKSISDHFGSATAAKLAR